MEWFDRRYEFHLDRRPEWEWELQGCCGVEEKLFLTFYGVYVLLYFVLGSCYALKPMRLLTVFLHEFGHASGE